MKQTIILLGGILILGLSGLVAKANTVNESSNTQLIFVQEQDENLEIQEWMINDELWTENDNHLNVVIEEKDRKLLIEKWMVDGIFWSNKSTAVLVVKEEVDQELKIEDWMLDI